MEKESEVHMGTVKTEDYMRKGPHSPMVLRVLELCFVP